MNRSLYLRKIKNLRDQVDMLLQEATLKDTARDFLEPVALGMFNNFFKSDFVANSPELKSFGKALERSVEKGSDSAINMVIAFAGKTQDQMYKDAQEAGQKAGAATGFSGDRGDYGNWDTMNDEQRKMAEKGHSMYWKAYSAAYEKSLVDDMFTGTSNMQRAADSIKADTNDGFFTKMSKSLKSMYNKGLEYWHKFSTSGAGRFIAYTFLCLGVICAIAMIMCLVEDPDDKTKTVNLMSQFYSKLKDSIAKAFKQGTLKGIMAVLVAPFDIILGTIGIMGQSASGIFCILTIVFLFLAAVMFYGDSLKLDQK